MKNKVFLLCIIQDTVIVEYTTFHYGVTELSFFCRTLYRTSATGFVNRWKRILSSMFNTFTVFSRSGSPCVSRRRFTYCNRYFFYVVYKPLDLMCIPYFVSHLSSFMMKSLTHRNVSIRKYNFFCSS